jgi:acetyltransferase
MPQDLSVIFNPKSIAVVGASRTRGKVGWEILNNLLRYEFRGTVYPVNPNAQEVHSIKAYPSVLDIPDPVDLAIIVVPREAALQAVEECGQKGVKGLIIITAGFKEVGGAGEALEDDLRALLSKHGMRAVGPNCMGIINTEAGVQMDATFAPTLPLAGGAAFMSQSGAVGVGILDHAKSLQVGLSKFVSLGNKTDISGNDLLRDWEADPETDIILMYVENVGNPRNFLRIARRLTKKKPIIAIKSGRTVACARAALSHTASMAGSDIAVDALFNQTGVLRVNTIEELFDLAMAFTLQPRPKGNRVAVVTDAGGPGIMATDTLVSLGMEIATLKEETKKRMRAHLVDEAIVENPVDMTAHGDAVMYKEVLEAVLEDDGVDAVVVIYVPPLPLEEVRVAETIWTAAKDSEKPVLCCFLARNEQSPGFIELVTHGVPSFLFPESAAFALASMDRYRRYLERDEGEFKTFEVDREGANAVLREAKAAGHHRLREMEACRLLEAYGFQCAGLQVVKSMEEALEAAGRVGYPVALKATGPDIVHKSDMKALALDLRDERDLREAFAEMSVTLEGVDVDGYVVQEFIRGAKETIVGMSLDERFGPLIVFGLGGIYVEYLKDVAFGLAPLTDMDARRMVESVQTYPLLKGVRGEEPSDVPAIEEAILRLSQLVMDHPEITEMDLNPLMVLREGEGCRVVDARIRIA